MVERQPTTVSQEGLENQLEAARLEGVKLLIKCGVMRYIETSPSWGGNPSTYPKEELVASKGRTSAKKLAEKYAKDRTKFIRRTIKPLKRKLGLEPYEPEWHAAVRSMVSEHPIFNGVEKKVLLGIIDPLMDQAVQAQVPKRRGISAKKVA